MNEISLEAFVAKDLAPRVLAAKSDKPTVIVLSCMDYRYPHRILDVLDAHGLRRKYDTYVIAGAALGANKKANWLEAFVEHILAARSTIIGHPLDEVLILEHRDCGAYKFFGEITGEVMPSEELKIHEKHAADLATVLKARLAKEGVNLKVTALLLTRDEDDKLTV